MGDKKRLPTGLAEKQELQRQETINKVLRACTDIKSEGGEVTISSLVEYTQLSRSTFAKPHIRELLAKYGYVSDNGSVATSKRKKVKQAAVIVEKDRQIADLRVENKKLGQECELLRGKIYLLLQKQLNI